MPDIWNLGALCRCCHTDGNFKSLQIPYMCDGNLETYSVLLRNTFGINIKPPPRTFEASYTICDDCITQLRDASQFKQTVISCEKQFDDYCKNEQALATHSDLVKIKEEFPENSDSVANNYSDVDEKYGDDDEVDDKRTVKLDGGQCDNVAINHSDVDEKYGDDDEVDDKSSVKLDGGQGTDSKYIDSSPVKIKCEGESSRNKIETTINGITDKNGPVVQKKRPKKITTGKGLTKKRIIKKKTDPALEVHVKTENGTLYSCKQCGGSYNELKKLRIHIYDNHIRQTLKCEHCPKKYKNFITLKNHLMTHGDERPYKCTYCPKSFKLKKTLSEHLILHTGKKIFKCDICQKEFSYKYILRKHIKWYHGKEKNFMCEMCGHSFNDATNYRKHVQTVHEKLRPFHCEICTKTFSAKKHLVNHIRVHNEEKPHSSDICSPSFSSSDYVKSHKLASDNTSRMKYTCVVCNKVLLDRGRFRKHVRSHTGNLPFKCHLCPKDFSCKYSMKRHVNEHFGIRPHSCEICQKSFKQKTQLNRHMRNLHDPDKKSSAEKVKCDVCKMNVYDLDKHKKAHFVRPHKCNLCEKSYSQKNALNRHVESFHFGKKKHECNFCGKKYIGIDHLKTHKMKKHKHVLKKEMEDNFDNVVPAYSIQNKTDSVDDDNM